MERRCYTYQGVHIPECWGCVIYGHRSCTCEPPVKAPPEPADPIETRLLALERKVTALSDLLEAKARP